MITKAWVEKSEHMPYLSSLHINDDYGNEYSIELRPKTGDYLLIIEALQQCVQADLLICPQCGDELHMGYCARCKSAFEIANR